jgi:hypothetical protein
MLRKGESLGGGGGGLIRIKMLIEVNQFMAIK